MPTGRMSTGPERAAMRRALQLAAQGLGTTSPNPSVGAVVLAADGRTPVGEGRTAPAGGPHAEVTALSAAGQRAAGGTVVVTFEPCRHQGRTPPCTQAILSAGIRRLVYALDDPDPGAGGGAGELAAAGVQVEAGVGREAAARLVEPWLVATRERRPFVTLKLATSLDGRAAAADGTSRWITGSAARADAHRLRASVDAILVGVGTVLADDPELTARTADGGLADHQPLRVVLDTAGRTPPAARVRGPGAPTLVLTGADVPPAPGGGLEPAGALQALWARGVRHVLVEGGPRVAASFAASGLVDRVVAYLAPLLLAGAPTLGAGRRFSYDDVVRTGEDVRLTLRPEKAVG